jgi:hypothetical protein
MNVRATVDYLMHKQLPPFLDRAAASPTLRNFGASAELLT